MNKIIEKICNFTIDNYRKAKQELRFDGDYINHFASLVYAKEEREIPIQEVKKVRSLIKNETTRMSSFRGDILYIISLLVALEEDVDKFIENMLCTYDKLAEIGFRECPHLVLSSYALVKYVKEEDRDVTILNMRELYGIIRANYNNVTNHEDYLQCALLAINKVNKNCLIDYMDEMFSSFQEIETISNNNIQSLSMTLALNSADDADEKVKNVLLEYEHRNIKISHQFVPLLAMLSAADNAKVYVSKVQNIINYLCSQEPEYEFYMDKGFRQFIGIVLLSIVEDNNIKYVNELLSLGIYTLLLSKNQGIFEEVLA